MGYQILAPATTGLIAALDKLPHCSWASTGTREFQEMYGQLHGQKIDQSVSKVHQRPSCHRINSCAGPVSKLPGKPCGTNQAGHGALADL